LNGKVRSPKLTTEKPDVAWAFAGRISSFICTNRELLSAAIGFFCSDAWRGAREIGRTGLADLKQLVGDKEFGTALAPHMQSCTKAFGRLL
jgi:hypothetical protein